MKNRILAVVTFILGLAQILTILVSWLITATLPTLPVRSLLGSEGIRWFFARFTDNLASPLLVWIILAGMALGVLRLSGLSKALRHLQQNEYRQRFALKLVLFEVVVFAIVIGLLTLIPQAILLGVTGHLFPGSFSQSIVAILCFIGCATSITFGLQSGTFRTLTDIFKALSSGIGSLAPWIVVYVIAAQLYHSILFVFLVNTWGAD